MKRNLRTYGIAALVCLLLSMASSFLLGIGAPGSESLLAVVALSFGLAFAVAAGRFLALLEQGKETVTTEDNGHSKHKKAA